jgi:quinol monooxygenase YgiN
MNHYYVYYKIAPDRAPQMRAMVEKLFQEIEKQCGVRGRWMRRRDDPSTYMEVYEGVKDGAAFEALLQLEGVKLGVPRRLEIFSPVETPS